MRKLKLLFFVLFNGKFYRKALVYIRRRDFKKIFNRAAYYFSITRIKFSDDSTLSEWMCANVQIDVKKICYFDHDLGGGANQYLNKLIQIKKEENVIFLIRYNPALRAYIFTAYWRENKITFNCEKIEDVFFIALHHQVSEIVINELVSYPDVLGILKRILNLKKILDADLHMLVHDYFAVCPTFILLDYQDKFCAASGYKNCGICYDKVNNNQHPALRIDTDVDVWRSGWKAFLNKCDIITAFSGDSKSIMETIFGALPQIEIVPHKVNYIEAIVKTRKTTNTLNIGFLGGISKHKGLHIIQEMANILDRKKCDIRLILIGFTEFPIKGLCFKETGKYRPEDVPALTLEHDIDIFLILSIWPETFSYTTQEIIEMGMPAACFDIGAPAERIKEYKKGFIIPNMTAECVIDTITEWYNKDSEVR